MAMILIIEDNAANMKLASLLVRNVGHTVLAAVDAETGLTLARAEHPDLILMDIQLPWDGRSRRHRGSQERPGDRADSGDRRHRDGDEGRSGEEPTRRL
jgi:CheY-like chemotaxis protein